MGAPITCASCQRRVLVSKETNWTGTRLDGTGFVLCGRRECFAAYPAVYNSEEADALKSQGGEA